MNKILFTIILILFSIQGFAQIGIGTENPEGLLHIDAKKNNSEISDNSKYDDDIIITEDGRIGVGTKNPEGLLHIDRLKNNDTDLTNPARLDDDFIVYENGIKTGISSEGEEVTGTFVNIADGTEGEGKVLISDKNGMASWADKGGYANKIVLGAKTEEDCCSVAHHKKNDDGSYSLDKENKVLGMEITLPPGDWEVNTAVKILFAKPTTKTDFKDNYEYLLSFAPSKDENGSVQGTTADATLGSIISAFFNYTDWNIKTTTPWLTEAKNIIGSGYYFVDIKTLYGKTIIQNKSSEDKTYYLYTYGVENYNTQTNFTNHKELSKVYFVSLIDTPETYMYAKQINYRP